VARCTVRHGNYSLEIEANSLYRAILAYDCRVVCGFPDALGLPRPDPDDVLTVTVDGREFRATHRQAMDWANQRSEQVCRREKELRESRHRRHYST